jgi:hypothetical protein
MFGSTDKDNQTAPRKRVRTFTIFEIKRTIKATELIDPEARGLLTTIPIRLGRAKIGELHIYQTSMEPPACLRLFEDATEERRCYRCIPKQSRSPYAPTNPMTHAR